MLPYPTEGANQPEKKEKSYLAMKGIKCKKEKDETHVY